MKYAYMKTLQKMTQFLIETIVKQCVGLVQYDMVYSLHVEDACKI